VIPVVTRDETRAIDASADDPVDVLVERAGAAVARAALEMLGGAYGRTVAVLAGPGNNGADGRVAAERLRARGAAVHVYDARDMPADLPACDLVIDAAFGTGFRGSWSAPGIGGARVLAVDVPTGLDSDTGVAPSTVLRADRTVTFAAAKPGHFIGDGPDVVGELTVADIGLPAPASMGVVQADDVATWVPRRDRHSHKWRHAVRLVAGSPGMTGAAVLAASAAQRTGSGMVVASSPGVEEAVLAALFPLEVVGRGLAHVDWSGDVLSDIDRFGSLVVGPGLGRHAATIDATVRTLGLAVIPAVVDGDGLFALANDDSGGLTAVRARVAGTVLTPHEGEFATLTGSSPSADRVADVRRLVDDTGSVVLLKGATTVVAGPGGRTYFVVDGDARLATAGTGDVLAGIIGALLAMGAMPLEAAAGGAWIHARAGAMMAPLGLVASDLIAAIPLVLNSLASPY
jgi:ADP-dependent NAD(P)H-hydrate dehydratase / NAD(P)H-hydrate epimerase